jgi:hypothetical protein
MNRRILLTLASRQGLVFKIKAVFIACLLRSLPDLSVVCRCILLMVLKRQGVQGTLDLRIGVRVPASQPH